MRAWPAFPLRGPWHAVGVSAGSAFLSLLLPPLSYVSGATVALVTLTQGTRASLQVVAMAVLALTLLGWAVLGHPWLGGLFLAVLWGPLWLLAKVLQATSSLSLALEAAAGVAVLAVVAWHLWVGSPEVWWREALETLQALPEETLDALAKVMTGALGAGWALSLALTLFLARGWQALLYHPGAFRREFHGLRLGRGMALAALVLAVLGLLPGPWGAAARDSLLVALAIYALAGLALIHDGFGRLRLHWGWLALVYGGIAFEPTLLVPILAALGWTDSGFDLRRYLGRLDRQRPKG